MKSRICPWLLVGILLFGSNKAKAQFSVFGGAQMTTANYKIRGVSQETEFKPGFLIGAGYTAFFEGPLYFSPQLSFTRKGYKVKFDRPAFPPDSSALNNDLSVNTIELAPLFQINFSKQTSHGFFRFGPAFDFNISGNEKFDTSANKPVSRKMKFSFGDYSYAGISFNAQFGFQHKSGLLVFAQYVHGVSSLNNADFGPQIFHRVFGLSVGWTLGKKK